jgi:uncharacterized protein YbjT (DUF2867 family)
MNNLTNDSAKTPRSKILVLGATGGTGRLIVGQALERGQEVTALVRSPGKASDQKGVKVIVGDVRDEKMLREALKGQDALVSAMKAEHVSRLVCITGIGAGDTAGHGGFLFDNVIFPLLLKKVYADKNRQETIVRNSGLDWVLVRPSLLNDQPGRGSVRALTDLSDFHGGSISRQDVASFVLDQLRTDAWLHRAPLITW